MFRIKKLDIFIAKQFLLLFVAAFFICQFVLMMQFLWKYVDDLIGKGLTIDVLAEFFWYMGLMLVPQAFPLAILLSSLITFGNLGESSELTAIKAAGISLMQAFRPLIIISLLVAGVSFFFQNVIGPEANKKFMQLVMSMKQTSPELEIPEGIFYDGIPGSNIYVEQKDMQTGKLYGVMIYRMTNSYEDQAIILADSGMLQSTADKQHLLLTLWNGEWFENMRSQDVAGGAEVPYRRETFGYKEILIDFNGDFNLADANTFSGNAKAKSLKRILRDVDSLRLSADTMGRGFYSEARHFALPVPTVGEQDSLRALAEAKSPKADIDTLMAALTSAQRLNVYKHATQQAQQAHSDVLMKSDYARWLNRQIRQHELESIAKFTLALSCIIFFFIGAPLGAIIRKGGLGVPVILSVLVFIVYYVFEHLGTSMAKADNWNVWAGGLISTLVLLPLAVFVTFKANNDSTVFNFDLYRQLFRRVLGLREKRSISRKEVIIHAPCYADDARRLADINAGIAAYQEEHNLLRWPNPLHVFFRPGDDHAIQTISDQLEEVIEDLGNTRDKKILTELNRYPILAPKAHTRPFQRRWLNVVTGLCLPAGIFFYFRMLRYRFRLYRDLRTIADTSEKIIRQAEALSAAAA